MTSVTALRPKLQVIDTSSPWLAWLSGSALDSTAVANAIAGWGWSVQYHEAPDYEASLMILPDDDDGLSTFVISAAAARFRLQECRDDALRHLGEFATLGDAVVRLRRAMADQVVPPAGCVAGQA